MRPGGMVGALIAGGIGALIWGGMAFAFHREFAIVAWIVGGLVGFGSVAGGGKGSGAGAFCALVTVGAILCGKAFGFTWIIEYQVAQDLFKQLKPQAQKLARMQTPTDRDYRRFMIEYGYTDATRDRDVAWEDVDFFKTEVVPVLEDMGVGPRFLTWKDDPGVQALVADVTREISISAMVIDNLGLFDVLFVIFGVGTAFRVGMADSIPDTMKTPTRRPGDRHRDRDREREREPEMML